MTEDEATPLIKDLLAHVDQVRHVFLPHVDKRVLAMKNNPSARLAYYTTADTAYRILANRELWLRNTSTMNDYSEVQHGYECLKAALNESASGKRFAQTIDGIFPGVFEAAVKQFDGLFNVMGVDTYIACFSEHSPVTEDKNGRLSMWRAYGGNSGVAFVLRPEILQSIDHRLKVYSSPVAYWGRAEVEEELNLVADRVAKNSDFVRKRGFDITRGSLFTLFKGIIFCTKHPGFGEELEWRVMATPLMEPSPLLTSSIESIGGTPQIVQKLQLRSYPNLQLELLEPNALIERVIVGPSQHPYVVASALVRLLNECGVERAMDRVVVSEIPLRVAAR